MAAVEGHKKKRENLDDIGFIPQKRTELDDFMDGYNRSVLEQRKNLRNKIDAAVPRILSLTSHQTIELAVDAFLILALYNSSAYSDPKLEKSVSEFYKVLRRGSSGVPPKQYEALVKQVWKTAKAQLDESLESPEAKRLLAPKGPSKK